MCVLSEIASVCTCTYLHSVIQLVWGPTEAAQLSIVEVYKKPSLTKGEQTAVVCSGFPNKHSTRVETHGRGEKERVREKERRHEKSVRESEVAGDSKTTLCTGKLAFNPHYVSCYVTH